MTETPVLPIVRIAVLADGRITDIALPASLPLREILPAVRRLAMRGEPDDGSTLMTLAPVGGAPFSVDASLDTVGVVDGDLLALQPVPAGAPAPGIVEDVADAAVIFSAARRKGWGHNHLRAGALVGSGLSVVAGTVVAATDRMTSGTSTGLYVAAALAIVTVLASLLLRPRSPLISSMVSLLALVPIGVTFWLAVPGPAGPAQILLTAAGTAAWSFIVVTQSEKYVEFFTATTAIGIACVIVAGISMAWELPSLTWGCALIAAGLVITVAAPQLSATLARLPLPVIPAPGDPTPAIPSEKLLADLPRRVRLGEAHQTGLIAAGVMLSAAGSILLASGQYVPGVGAPGVWVWYLIGATGFAAVLRARVWDTVTCKVWLLSQPYLVLVGLVGYFTVNRDFGSAAWSLAVLALLALFWIGIAADPKFASAERYSLPVRRTIGFVAVGVDASLIPAMAYLAGIFTWVLDR